MSTTSRVIIAVACLAFASGCVWTQTLPSAAQMSVTGCVIIVAFLLVIAITCIPGRHTAVTGRLIGGVVFGAYVAYVISEIVAPTPHQPYKSFWDALLDTGEADLPNALIGLVVWGLPAGYVMIFGWDESWLPGLCTHGEKACSSEEEAEDEE